MRIAPIPSVAGGNIADMTQRGADAVRSIYIPARKAP
jgi:hypothetical protein